VAGLEPFFCMPGGGGEVCAAKGKSRQTYANACYARMDGAASIKAGACRSAHKKMSKR
jgi:hypothetical protein